MSQKPGKADTQEKKRKRKKKTKQTLTSAVTHIHLIEANPGKLSALDQVATVYQALCFLPRMPSLPLPRSSEPA